MKKAIYIILGLLIGAFIAATLVMESSKVQTTSYNREINIVEEVETEVEQTKNIFILDQINRLDELIYELKSKEGYFITEDKLNEYIGSKVVVYGRANPMLYMKMDIVIEDDINEFEASSGDEFLTSDGNSIGYDVEENKLVVVSSGYIERAFLNDGKMPILDKYYQVSSPFGLRKDPINKNETRFHIGLDVATPEINGQQVFATLDGRIDLVINNGGYGNYVVINHGGFNTVYAHLEGFGRNIKEGKTVKAGDVIGYVGSTGRSTGPHLHFEVETNGVKLNPEHFINIMRGTSTMYQDGYWPTIEDLSNEENQVKIEEEEDK